MQAIHTVPNRLWKDRPWIPQAPEILDDLKYQAYWMEKVPIIIGTKELK